MNDEKSKQGSFVEHLAELRLRLVKSFTYLFICFIICYFFAENIYEFLVEPYADAVRNDETNRRRLLILLFKEIEETKGTLIIGGDFLDFWYDYQKS